jgi:hypothetical protein
MKSRLNPDFSEFGLDFKNLIVNLSGLEKIWFPKSGFNSKFINNFSIQIGI